MFLRIVVECGSSSNIPTDQKPVNTATQLGHRFSSVEAA